MGRTDAAAAAECPIDKLWTFADADKYPAAPETPAGRTFDDLKIVMAKTTMGPKSYIFALGSSKNLEKSPKAIKATIVVCGKETLAVT